MMLQEVTFYTPDWVTTIYLPKCNCRGKPAVSLEKWDFFTDKRILGREGMLSDLLKFFAEIRRIIQQIIGWKSCSRVLEY